MAGRLNHTLLDEFLGFVLDRYKAGALSRASAIGDIGHLVAVLDLPEGEGDNPNSYMKVVLADGEDG